LRRSTVTATDSVSPHINVGSRVFGPVNAFLEGGALNFEIKHLVVLQGDH